MHLLLVRAGYGYPLTYVSMILAFIVGFMEERKYYIPDKALEMISKHATEEGSFVVMP